MSVYTLIFFLELLHIIVMKHFPSVFKYSDSIFQFMIFMGGETQPKLACHNANCVGLFYINFPQSSFAVVYKYHGQLHQRGHNHVKHQICLCYTQTGQNKSSLSLQPLSDYFLFILTCMFLSTFLCYSFYLKIAFIMLLHNGKTPKMQSLSFYTMEKNLKCNMKAS